MSNEDVPIHLQRWNGDVEKKEEEKVEKPLQQQKEEAGGNLKHQGRKACDNSKNEAGDYATLTVLGKSSR